MPIAGATAAATLPTKICSCRCDTGSNSLMLTTKRLAGVLPNLSHFGGADYPTDLGFMAA